MLTAAPLTNPLSTPAQRLPLWDSIGRVLSRLAPWLQRQKQDSLETLIVRSIEQAFAEFAKEMGR